MVIHQISYVNIGAVFFSLELNDLLITNSKLMLCVTFVTVVSSAALESFVWEGFIPLIKMVHLYEKSMLHEVSL